MWYELTNLTTLLCNQAENCDLYQTSTQQAHNNSDLSGWKDKIAMNVYKNPNEAPIRILHHKFIFSSSVFLKRFWCGLTMCLHIKLEAETDENKVNNEN